MAIKTIISETFNLCQSSTSSFGLCRFNAQLHLLLITSRVSARWHLPHWGCDMIGLSSLWPANRHEDVLSAFSNYPEELRYEFSWHQDHNQLIVIFQVNFNGIPHISPGTLIASSISAISLLLLVVVTNKTQSIWQSCTLSNALRGQDMAN